MTATALPVASGQGQWALGERAPLNHNEQFKQDDGPLEVRKRIEQTYSRLGFASITSDDLRGRFRWFGLYTQRRPGIDGGRTAVLEPHELEDEHFMLRIRIDGGRLDADQLRAIAEVSTQYARDTADLTDRQNVQLHWVHIEDVPAIWRTLEAVGLSTTEACGDCPRVVVGSPVAGISPDELVDPSPAIDEITRRFVGDPDLANLPRKWKTSISWLPDVPYLTNDIAMIGAVHPEHGPGFDLWVGGGLSTNPMLARRLGVWVPLADVPDVWLAVTRLFRDYGYRRLRHRARLKFLLADWGVARFREVLETEYLGRRLVDGPAAQTAPRMIDHMGVHRQRDGRWYVGATPIAGRVSGTALAAVARLAQRHGSGRVRTTVDQKLLILDVEEADVAPLTAALAAIGLQVAPSTWRRDILACTGIEFCKLAIVETKARAAELVAELERHPSLAAAEISISLSGCPNACARTQVADIGLKGQLVRDASGALVEGFQIHLGGSAGLAAGATAGFGRKVRGLKVTAAELPAYVRRVAAAYLDQRHHDEPFAAWALRADEMSLR
ncbi:nitrite/sulfite reductase [Pilimelia columellifera]|uniref:assimilatory sulfite reductase (ferredoxin) n=1 Tax=Pilimelia columellifera subsp. columellifera TaxID=706583 RepID=A0ABN3NLI5_9ACTN